MRFPALIELEPVAMPADKRLAVTMTSDSLQSKNLDQVPERDGQPSRPDPMLMVVGQLLSREQNLSSQSSTRAGDRRQELRPIPQQFRKSSPGGSKRRPLSKAAGQPGVPDSDSGLRLARLF